MLFLNEILIYISASECQLVYGVFLGVSVVDKYSNYYQTNESASVNFMHKQRLASRFVDMVIIYHANIMAHDNRKHQAKLTPLANSPRSVSEPVDTKLVEEEF